MWFWSTLNIEETNDTKEIKKAYSKLLKQCNPEADAEGYQNLRKAYDEAINYAKNKYKKTFSNHNLETLDLKTNENLTYTDISINDSNEEVNNFDSQAFTSEVRDLYFNKSCRNDAKLWSDLLDKYIADNLENITYVEISLLNFINDYFCFPKNIYILFDKYFNWSEHDFYICKYCNDDILAVILSQINPNWLITFGNMYNLKDINLIEFFIKKVEAANLFLESNKLTEMKSIVDELYDIFKEDGDLYGLYGVYYVNIGEEELALDMVEKSVYYNNYNFYFVSLLAYLKLNKFQYEEAYKLLNFVKNEINCPNLNSCSYFTYSYAVINYNHGNYEEAKEYFYISLNEYPYFNKLIKKYLKNINNKISGKNTISLDYKHECKILNSTTYLKLFLKLLLNALKIHINYILLINIKLKNSL